MDDVKCGLCEYVIVHTILPPSPVILWIELGGKPKVASIEFWIPWRKCAQAPLTIFALPGGIWTPNAGNETWNSRPRGKGTERRKRRRRGESPWEQKIWQKQKNLRVPGLIPGYNMCDFFPFRILPKLYFQLLSLCLSFRSCVSTSIQPQSVSSDMSIWMGCVRITSWYPNFNGSHFGLPPSEIHRMTGLGGKKVIPQNDGKWREQWCIHTGHIPWRIPVSLRWSRVDSDEGENNSKN